MSVVDEQDVRSSIALAIANAIRVRGENRRSLLTWGKRFFPDYFKLPFGQHHRELDAAIRRWHRQRGVKAAVEAPRGCAKSTMLTFLDPLYAICERLEDYILILADTHTQASKHVQGIQFELENNPALAEAYPHVCGIGPKWSSDGILTRNGVRVEPLGAGQKIRGRREKAARPSHIIIDDPEGELAAVSPTARKTIRDWATKAVLKAGHSRTNFTVAGTVIHRECLVAHLAHLPGWESMSFKSIIKWPDRMDLWDLWERILQDNTISQAEADTQAKIFFEEHEEEMLEGAEVLWPELEDLYALMFMRASDGHTSFESEKQNNPIDPSKCEWEPSLFEGDDLYFDQWPKDCLCRVMALDPSKGKRDKSGDYQAIIMLAVDDKGDLLVDTDIKRRPISQMLQAFITWARDFKPDTAVCEAEQFQELLLGELDDVAIQRQLIVPLEGITTGKINKQVRIRRLGPYVSRRRIRYRRKSPGIHILRQQLMDFPNGDHDDGADALEMAVRRATELLADQESDGTVDSPY